MRAADVRFTTFSCLFLVLGMCTAGFALPHPVEEWSIELGGDLAVSATPYPSASPDSVIIAAGGRMVRVDGTGKIIARFEFGPEEGRGRETMAPPAELDGDPDEELVLTHRVGILFGFDVATKTILWETDLGDSFGQYTFARAGDVDGDGLDEVVATTMSGLTTCLDSNGKILWRTRVHTVNKCLSSELSTPAIGDVNSDGHAEIVYGTATHHLIALDRHGRLLWDSVVPPHQMNRTPVLIADADQDGRAEVYSMSSMVSPGKGLACVNGKDGKPLWTGLTVGKAYLGLKPVRFSDGSHGILACDKGGNIHAHRADGSLAWHTRVSGRGVYSPPAVADLDGDGRAEIVATIRATSLDGKEANWYVLDADTGKLLGGYHHGNGHPAPVVCDIDRDGVLEVLIMSDWSQKGRLTAFSFGGPATKDAVYVGAWYEPRYPAQIKPATPPRSVETPELQLFPAEPPRLRFGNNVIDVRLPRPADSRQIVELECIHPDGIRRIEARSADKGAQTLALTLSVSRSGKHALTLRLRDAETGKTLGEQKRTVEVDDVVDEIAKARSATTAALRAARAQFVAEGLESATFMAQLIGEVDSAFELLAARIAKAAELSPGELEKLLVDTDAYMILLDRRRALGTLTLAEVKAERRPSFIMWQDTDPWDNLDPLDDLPGRGGPLTIDAWAFGKEIESLCANIVNLTPHPLWLRVEPGTLKAAEEREGVKLPSVLNVVGLHTTVPLPAGRETVPDMLPRLGEGKIIEIAPGQVRQLWLNLSTHELPAGAYELRWVVRTLDDFADRFPLTVRLDVSPVRCPDKSRFIAGYWRGTNLYGHNVVPDMNEHLVTIWHSLPLPAAKANAQGEIVGELDWTAHDEIVEQIEQPEILLYTQGQVPAPSFPEGVEVTDELRLKGQRAFAKRLVAHLAELGLGYEDFMFYPEDEPGLKGEITSFLKNARRNKLVDPKIQNFANPWGAFTREMLHQMWEVTDVWQPGMEVLEFWGKEAVDIMGRGGKRIGMFTPPAGVRSLRPLGFYRSQAWLALHWGIEGGGWFAYQINDLFITGTWGPGYGAVHTDARDVVTSRRWEAQRDGIEDFNIVSDLRDLAREKGDTRALAVIDEAVAYVAGRVLTGATREAAEYDFPYGEFMPYRSKLRREYERLLRQ